MAKDASAKSPRGKGGKGRTGARGSAASGPALPSVANHPRAAAQVARAKAWAGLAGFLLVGWLSLQAGVPTADLLLRALAAGVGAYVLAWACAVAVWRHLVIAELRAVRRARAEAAARMAAQRAEAQ
jgi:hypothetical protein